MSGVINLIGVCPPALQDDSMLEQKCLEVLKDIRRIVIKDPDGADPFNDAATTALGTFAALQASVETKTKWDNAIIEVDADKITLTPAIHDAQRPKTLIEPIELPDGTRILPGNFPDQMATYTIYGISPANHKSLMKMIGLQKDFLLIDKAGKTLFRKLSDAEVANGDSCWYNAKLFNCSTRDVMTGAGNADNIDLQIFSEFGDLDDYAIADTSSFALII